MAERDDSLDKLEQFNKTVADVTGDLKGTGLPAIQEAAGELNQLFQTATTAILSLTSAIRDGGDKLDDAAEELTEAVEDLGQTATDIADDRLSAASQQIERAGDRFVSEAGQAAEELSEAGQELESRGFKEAETRLKEAETALEHMRETVDAVFAELTQDVQQVGDRFEGTLVRAGERAAEAASSAAEQQKAIESTGEATVNTLREYASAAPDVYQGLEEQVTTFYRSLGEKALGKGDELIEAVKEALEEVTEVAKEKCVAALDAPFQIVLDEVLKPAEEELDEWVAAHWQAKGTVGDFPAFAEELHNAQLTARNISRKVDEGLGGA